MFVPVEAVAVLFVLLGLVGLRLSRYRYTYPLYPIVDDVHFS